MQILFFQTALLTMAAHAAAVTNEAEQTESYFPDLLVQTASLIDYILPNEGEQELSLMQNESHSEGEGENEAVSAVQGHANSSLMAEIEADCEADLECVEEELKNRTQVNMKDNKNNHLTIDMPADHKKKISYNSPKLEVVDHGFD